MQLYHNSHSAAYRYPFGARPSGACVTLWLQTDEACTSAIVRTWFCGREERHPMQRRGQRFEATLTLPGKPGLFWYYFIASDDTGRTVLYGNNAENLGGEGCAYAFEPPSFQITLYDPAFHTPDWMKRANLYQIFPDRFCSSGKKDASLLAEGCHYHESWQDAPENRIVNGDGAADDFFGGDLQGIIEKLPYLRNLGITALYLNPIFRARSNHKYDTANYREIDPTFGTEDDLRALCAAAEKMGIHVLLDGVFSHTGADSVYFDRFGRFGTEGAYQSPASPYASWYRFESWPDVYDCWWGFPTLPNVNELDPGYIRYMLGDEDSVVPHYIHAGTGGWRLDVADELPMDFLRALRKSAKNADASAGIVGEVWEDASRKEAYSELRSYCLGDTLDSCMNYPLRDALLAYLLGKKDAPALARVLESQRENYPAEFLYACMNLLGSHDKPRTLSVLAGEPDLERLREQREPLFLSPDAYALGKARYVAALQFLAAMPGMTSVYYGDEAGLVGMADPYCRGTYPWGQEDDFLLRQVRAILSGRQPVLRTGLCRVAALSSDVVAVGRWLESGLDAFGKPLHGPEAMLCILNRSDAPQELLLMPGQIEGFPLARPLPLSVPPCCAQVLSF